MSNTKLKNELISKFSSWFRDKIAKNHLTNTKKLKNLSEFDYNPFLLRYLPNFVFGECNPENLAKSLLYPRILGTSINTSFGQNSQSFFTETLKELCGSMISGIDIEFIDQVDGRKKYCQLKTGPNNINKDDIETIKNHFKNARNIGRLNRANISIGDLVVGVLYGTPERMNSFLTQLNQEYPVFIGKEFWHRLTGYENFYDELIDAFSKIADEFNSEDVVKEVIKSLASDIKKAKLA